MRRALLVCLCFVLLNPHPAAAEQACREFSGEFIPGDNGERLLALLVSLADPESMDLELSAIPGDDGAILAVSVIIGGGVLGGVRIERIALESAFVRLNSPSEWIRGDRRSLRILGALRSNFEIMVDERDMLEALKTYISGSWGGVRLELASGELRVQGRYRPGATGFSFLAGLSTKLELRDRRRVLLKTPRISINGEDKTALFQRDLERLRPVLDFDEFSLSLMPARLSVDAGKLLLGTAAPPGPAGGIRYRYVRDRERPFIMHPPESFPVPAGLFRDGDILLVCGKTWRSKIVNLLEDGASAFTHSGVVRVIGGVPYVVHASPDVELVQMERADDFLSPEMVYRASLFRVRTGPAVAAEASRNALEYYEERVPFDTAFDGEDHGSLYCTELVWRAYAQAGIDLADGLWVHLSNPLLSGRVLLPNSLIRSPLLEEIATLR